MHQSRKYRDGKLPFYLMAAARAAAGPGARPSPGPVRGSATVPGGHVVVTGKVEMRVTVTGRGLLHGEVNPAGKTCGNHGQCQPEGRESRRRSAGLRVSLSQSRSPPRTGTPRRPVTAPVDSNHGRARFKFESLARSDWHPETVTSGPGSG
jgi:hypothetical protein